MALKDKLMTLEDFKAVRDVDVASNNKQFTDIKADLDANNKILSLDDTVDIPFSITETGKSIKYSTGEIQNFPSGSITDYINISAFVSISYKRIKSTGTPTHGMAFYNANKEYVSGRRCTNGDSLGYQDSLFTEEVPETAVYARFTLLSDTATYGNFALSGTSALPAKLNEIVTDTNTDIANANARIDATTGILKLSDNITIPFDITDTKKYIIYSTGETTTRSDCSVTGYIDVSMFATLTYKRTKFALQNTSGMAFYNSTKTYISGVRSSVNQDADGYSMHTIEVPETAVYARFTVWSDTQVYGAFELAGESKLYNRTKTSESPFRKNVIFGNYSSDWYKAQGETYAGFTINTMYNDIVSAWDTLVTNSKGYITKESIGTASDGQTLYVYKMIPLRYRNNTGTAVTNNAPVIMTVASQHGAEKSAAYGTYYFARDLVYNFDKNPVLNSIRTKCILYVVPVANPYGFDNKTRKNANGVDLNRNWGPSSVTDPSSLYYGGAEPFDQPETQAIKSVIDTTTNMFFVVDFHTNGFYKVDSWANVNWIDYPSLVKVNDAYFNNSYIAGQYQISDISENLPLEYSFDTNGESIGSLTVASSNPDVPAEPKIGYYCQSQNILGFTFEGNNGLPLESDTSYSEMEQKINSEIIGNWIKNLLLVYRDAS